MTVVQNDVVRATGETSRGPDAIQNVMHYRSTNAASITDAQALIDIAQVMDTVFSTMIGFITTALSYDQVRAQNVTQDVLLGTAAYPSLIGGTIAGDQLPLQNAAILNFPSSKPKTRGSVFLGGFTEADNAPTGILSGGLQTALVSMAVILLGEIVLGPNSWRYVVFNTILKTFVLPTGSVIPAVWRTQRRRRPGVGI